MSKTFCVLVWKEWRHGIGQWDDEEKGYTMDQIQKMLDQADLRMKVIILIMATTGMRVGLAQLKCRDMTKIEDYSLYRTRLDKKSR